MKSVRQFLENIRYVFEKKLAKSGLAMFLSLVFIFAVCYFFIVTLRFLLVALLPQSEDVFHDFSMHMWVTWLAMTDPGNMNQDNLSHVPFKITAMLAGVLGVIIFSTVIAYITTLLENNYYNLRKGRGKVLEHGHTLILGWNDKVIEIIKELIVANESQRKAAIVVLSDFDKEKMDDALLKYFPNTKTTEIFISAGDPGNLSDLKRVNASKAKSAIILANCSESSSDYDKELSDIHAIKTILALYSVQGNVNHIPVIVELFNPTKNQLINFFNDPKIIALDNWRIMGKLLLQTSLTSGLIKVYDEMLSYVGNEIYFTDYVGPKILFSELPFYFVDGVPLGLEQQNGSIHLRPNAEMYIEKGDRLIILAEDDSTIKMHSNRIQTQRQLPAVNRVLQRNKKRILILGWHEIGFHYINESKGHFVEGTTFTIAYPESVKEISQKVKQLQKLLPEYQIELVQQNPFIYDELVALQPYSFDIVLILPQNINEASSEKKDTDTLIILMMLRQIGLNFNIERSHTKLISQVLESDNQDLIIQTEINDFITSNKLITKMMAQLSEQIEMKALYDDLFSNEGSEIYVKPCHLYFDEERIENIPFIDIMMLVRQRNEICLGVRIASMANDPDKNFGIILNPAKLKPLTLTKHDYLVVLAEDEL